MEILSHSLKETEQIAIKIAAKFKLGKAPSNVICLYGDLGSGKTMFVRFFVKALGFDNRVQSPTFILLRKYSHDKSVGGNAIDNINHLDLYRITSKEEVLDLGLNELVSEGNSLTIIEWPKLAEGFLPAKTVKIYFEYADENSRKIKV